MQLHQLSYFVAVAETRHFTQAAERIGVAQPSLSQQIRALERDVGAPLFHRVRGNITLTEAGDILLPIARRILADVAAARDEIGELGELRRGHVRLGATPSLCTGVLPPILAGFRRRHPGVTIAVAEGGSRDLQRDLTEGALDLALVVDSRRRAADPQLLTLPVLDEELVLVSRLDDPPPVGTRTVRPADLAGLPLVMFRQGYDLRDATVAACRDAGFEPSFAVEGGEMDAVLEFVAAGVGVAVVPATVARGRFRTTSFRRPGLRRTVRLARRKAMTPPRAVRALQDAILDALQAGTGPGTRALARRRA